eukprot:UN24533
MGVAQHHDAVSGTEKQHVAFDYAWRISRGRNAAQPMLSDALKTLTGSNQDFQECPLRNVSICDFTSKIGTDGVFTTLVWNNLGRSRQEWIEIPVTASSVQVLDASTNQPVKVIFVDAKQSVTNYGPSKDGLTKSILFQATLPPMGYRSFRITVSSKPTQPPKKERKTETISLKNAYYQLAFNANGMLSQITNLKSNITISGQQNFYWYNASVGNKEEGQHSGAYIFRPNKTEPIPIGTTVQIQQIGPNEVQQVFSDWLTQNIRLLPDENHIEFTYTVGEIPIGDHHGKEIISKFSFDNINNVDPANKTRVVFSTDSNGREMITRKVDYRSSWKKFNQTEPVAGNYYPCTTGIGIADTANSLNILTDASQGCASLQKGEIELMVHRRLLVDDSRGVGEPLNETEFTIPYGQKNGGHSVGKGLIIRGSHYLTLEPAQQSASVWRMLQDRVFAKPAVFFTEDTKFTNANVAYLNGDLPV